jgi:IclR family KDG regulon transcriptional repressor
VPLKKEKMDSVQAIDRAFLVLETIAKEGALSLNELHKTLHLNKASLSRIAATLYRNGYLNKNEKTGDYILSYRAFEIGVKAMRHLNHSNLIKSSLTNLSADLGVIAQFSVEDNNELLCLESINLKDIGFSIYTRVGQRSPLYSTSAGKAILSTYSNDEIIKKWDSMKIKSLTPKTITTIEVLLQEIAQIRQRNYALDMEESEYGLFCIGTVLLNYNHKPIGAISLSTNSMSDEKQKKLSSELLKLTAKLSGMLGYS